MTGSVPAGELALEIGDATWTVLGAPGVASLSTGVPPTIRLLRVPGCAVVIEFDATPGDAYVIRFTADGSALVEEWTDPDDGGLPFEPRDPVVCP